jgi:hypothetical protein
LCCFGARCEINRLPLRRKQVCAAAGICGILLLREVKIRTNCCIQFGQFVVWHNRQCCLIYYILPVFRLNCTSSCSPKQFTQTILAILQIHIREPKTNITFVINACIWPRYLCQSRVLPFSLTNASVAGGGGNYEENGFSQTVLLLQVRSGRK